MADKIRIALAAFLALAAPAAAQEIGGPPAPVAARAVYVVDGDTIRFDGAPCSGSCSLSTPMCACPCAQAYAVLKGITGQKPAAHTTKEPPHGE